MGWHACFDGADDDEGGVGHVQLGGEAAREDAGQAVDGHQVDDEGVATPRRHLPSKCCPSPMPFLPGIDFLIAQSAELASEMDPPPCPPYRCVLNKHI